ncbi:MAG: N-acetylmuramoyl-L-alanine amidase [Pseudomonadales bacterium]|jgi:N-acetylmuramoyl-L-alanine amidase
MVWRQMICKLLNNQRKHMVQTGIILAASLLVGQVFAADINGVRMWRAPDHTRLVFDLSGPVKHEILTLSSPERVVIDIPAASFKASFDSLNFASTPIKKLRSGVRNKNDLRLVLDMSQAIKPRSFLLAASGDLHDRLVVDLYDAKKEKSAVIISANHSKKRDIIIAIDAGHGGEDPGALGPGKLREKDVVLKMAKKLKDKIDQRPGYTAKLIRTGDYYIGLTKRRDLARKFQADMFVSIHADAFSDSRANGTSVYALSPGGATSASAKFLAQKANSADLVGGVSLSDKDDVLASVLFDLSMTASLDASLDVGREVLGQMKQVSRLHKTKVEQAGFAVLKSPDIPSILVETGFISNPQESRRLNSSSYQHKMADAIYTGIHQYFKSHPPDGTLIAWQQQNSGKGRQYVVSSGDTLSGIAMRHKVSLASLKRTNDMASSKIRVGQKLKIPGS